MMSDASKPWSLQPMTLTVTDKGKILTISDVQPWIEERKQLLRRAREILSEYDGTPASLFKHHATMVSIVRRLAEIKVIFDSYNQGRTRYAAANINAMVALFSDPKTMEGIDD